MSTDQTLIKLSGLRDGQLRRLLVEFISEMTLLGRATYVPQGEGLEEPQRLRRINEVIHRAADALKHLEERERGLAMELFASELEEPELTGVAFERAMNRLHAAEAADAHSGV